MFGKHRDGITNYSSQPQANNRGRPDTYTGHPTTVYLREDLLLEALAAFYTDQVLRPDQPDLLAGALARARHRSAIQQQAQRDELQRLLEDCTRRQDNLLQQAQNCPADDPYAQALRRTYNDLEAQRTRTLTALGSLDTATTAAGPVGQAGAIAALLDASPTWPAISRTRPSSCNDGCSRPPSSPSASTPTATSPSTSPCRTSTTCPAAPKDPDRAHE
jgi:site-specific DNA recombinase